MTTNTTTMNGQATTCCRDTTNELTKRPQSYRAPVDVHETDTMFRVLADMPGTTAGAIDISVEDNTLTIDAAVERRYEQIGKVRHREYGVGDFHRSFRIGGGIDAANITAKYTDGVLEVELPKAKATEPRSISIQAS